MEEKKEKSKVKFFTVLKYFWPHIKKYKWFILASILTTIIHSLTISVFSPIVYKNIIDSVTSSNPPRLSPEILFYFKLSVLFGVTNFAANRFGNLMVNRSQSKITESLQNEVFNRVVNRTRNFFANNFSGGLVAKSGRFVRSYESISDIVLYNFFGVVITLSGIFFILFKESSLLGFVFLVWFFVFAFVSFLFARQKVPYDEEKSSTESKTTSTFSDVISNILNIKIFSAFNQEFKNYSNVTKNEENARIKTWDLSVKQGTILNATMIGLRIFALWFVLNLWAKGQITVGFVVLVQLYSSQIFEMVWQFNFAVRNFGRAVTDAKEMVEIFETPIEIEDPVKPEKCLIDKGHILFENVSFQYKDGSHVFKNFNLEIKPGEKVGFVGHSGSGKTTITNLLLRFEDVQSGSVKIDGQDIKLIKQDDLRKNISYVPQEPVLFHRTLSENISYGKPNAKQKDILTASKKAHAHEFIKDFKDGYETLVGERGVKLSGGQRQRVAIARVMLKDAPILVLDEATSSLDSISENLIQKAFDEAMKGRTTLVIAHRLSTIQKMDRIIVLDKGKIVEDGTHTELLAKEGQYFKLWRAQKDGII